MSKLLNMSLRKIMLYAALVLAASIPAYYLIMSRLWQYELDEHQIVLTREAGREDSYLIILAITVVTVIFFVLMIIGLIFLNKRISQKLWQPFYNSLAQIRGFDLSQQNMPQFDNTEIDEFKELNQNLEKLITGNIAAYNQQKEFADNASHELQTPLAIVQSKLELLMQTNKLTGEQYALIEEASTALTRVSRINKNLLLLTKIGNSQFMEKETIDLSGLLQNTVQSFSAFASNKQIDIDLDASPAVMIEGNKILVEILVNNLLNNAIRHSSEQSTIMVKCTANQLQVTNPGTGPLRQDQLFKRFAGSSPDKPGTGLGLSLVKQIALRNNWSINYHFGTGQHIFSLGF